MSSRKFDLQNRTQILETTLGLFDAVEGGESVSQRSLAMRLGVALGLTNSLVKRCVKKGLLKVREVPARRFAYYLTPKGFREKSRLTAEYLSHSLKFFREARWQYDRIFETCLRNGWTRVVLYGAGELAEIASLAAAETGVELLAVVDPDRNTHEFCGLPVKADLAAAAGNEGLDAVVLTVTEAPQERYQDLIGDIEDQRVLAPEFLFVSRAGGVSRADGGTEDQAGAA